VVISCVFEGGMLESQITSRPRSDILADKPRAANLLKEKRNYRWVSRLVLINSNLINKF